MSSKSTVGFIGILHSEKKLKKFLAEGGPLVLRLAKTLIYQRFFRIEE